MMKYTHGHPIREFRPGRESASSPLVVLSNRGPQRWSEDHWVSSSGGLVTALDSVLRERNGVWVSTAERKDLPEPGDAGYEQVFVRLNDEVREGFYDRLANGVLWPALHGFPTIAEIGDAPWNEYEFANQAFAEAARSVVTGTELVWVQDYHLMLVPRMLRQQNPDLRVGWFCHVPWPDPDHFAVLPWRHAIIDGLLGASVLGFHTASYASNFLDCVEQIRSQRGDGVRLAVEVDRERCAIQSPGGTTRVTVAPVGIPIASIARLVSSEAVLQLEGKLRRAVGGRRIVLGVDRLDYTKGIPERLAAYARLLEESPDSLDEIVMVQIVVPSREDVPAYAKLKEEIDRRVGYINGRFARTGCPAVHHLYRSVDPVELYAHYRAADVALVTPLRDGMNLVAQEYVASRVNQDGALVLSEFAGAAEKLSEAYLVNPHDVAGVASQVRRALYDPPQERRRRMRSLRAIVGSLDVQRWANGFLEQLNSACAVA